MVKKIITKIPIYRQLITLKITVFRVIFPAEHS